MSIRITACAPAAQRSLLMLLLVAVLVTLDLLPAPAAGSFPDPRAAAYAGLVLGQIALLSAWLVFGRAHFLLRLAGTLVSIALLAHPLALRTAPEPQQLMSVLGLFAAAAAAPLAVLRLRGWQVIRSDETDAGDFVVRRWQFSLAALFVATTSLSIVLAAIRWTAFPWQDAAAALAYCLGFALVAWIALAAGHRGSYFWLRLVGCLLSAGTIGLALPLVESAGIAHSIAFATITVSESAILIAALAVVRVGGCMPLRRELVTAGRRAASTPAAEPHPRLVGEL